MTDTTSNTLSRTKQGKPNRPVRHSQPCQYAGCEKWAWAQGYCNNHYQKMKNLGLIQNKRLFGDALARFHTKYEIDEETGCWNWLGGKHPHGYGQYGVHEDGKTNTYRAHRYAYEKLVGPIPRGMKVLHKCDRRICCAPDHLFLGSDEDNMQDCVAKGRHSTQRGTNGPKLTKAMVANIRVMYARGLVNSCGTNKNPFSILEIARIYMVEEETIRGVVKGVSHLKA